MYLIETIQKHSKPQNSMISVFIFSQVKLLLRSGQVTDWLCPITGLLMYDTVCAADKFNYECAAITEWFGQGHNWSPQTKERMKDQSLVPNQGLRDTIKAFRDFVFGTAETLTLTWEPHGMRSEVRHVTLSRDDVSRRDAMQMCQALSKFFKELDPIEDLLRRMLRGLKPPKIVVVGDDSLSVRNIFFSPSMKFV